MHDAPLCPTCGGALIEGRCPACPPAAAVPPTPALTDAVMPGTEYPLGLPFTLAEIQIACDYRALERQLRPLAIIGIIPGALLVGLAMFINTRMPIIDYVRIGVCIFGSVIILRSIINLLLVSPVAFLVDASIAFLSAAILIPGAIIIQVSFIHLLTGWFMVLYAFSPIMMGLTSLSLHRRYAHLYGVQPSKELMHLLDGWLKSLRSKARQKLDDSILQFMGSMDIMPGHFSWLVRKGGLYHALQLGDYLLIAAINLGVSDIQFIHRGNFYITTDGVYPLSYPALRKAVIELGPGRILHGGITDEQLMRYERWHAEVASLQPPPASTG